MKNYLVPIFLAASCIVSTPALGQAGFEASDTGEGGGTVLLLSANGTCMDDCQVQSSVLGKGTVIAIMKRGEVVEQGYVDAHLDIQGDAAPAPRGGTGSRSNSFHSNGRNAAGETGSWVTTATYTYKDHKLRNIELNTEWVPDMDPPADEEDGG